MRAFLILESGDGEEEASDSSSVVEGRCEESPGVGESEAVAPAGSEEAASDSLQGCRDEPTGSLPVGPRGESESVSDSPCRASARVSRMPANAETWMVRLDAAEQDRAASRHERPGESENSGCAKGDEAGD